MNDLIRLIVFIGLICLIIVSAYSAGYNTGYNQGKEDWLPIGELAGRTNQIADQIGDDTWYSYCGGNLTEICKNCTFRNYSQSNITFSTNTSYPALSYNWSYISNKSVLPEE